MTSFSNRGRDIVAASQVRAARGLVGWSQGKLAETAGVPLSTVKRYEAGSVAKLSPDALAKMRAALESAGVEFIPENGGGAGVRLRQGRAPQTIAFEDLNASNDE
jgi:transcriptional regulator with XRE-family HTH domain